VIDAKSSPVASAKVAALGGIGNWQLALAESNAEGIAEFALPVDIVSSVFALKSGSGLDYFLTSRGREPWQFTAMPGEIALTLDAVKPLRVKAHDASEKPVAGLPIYFTSLSKSGKAGALGAWDCPLLDATTDNGGRATFDFLPPQMVGRTALAIESNT